MGRGEEFYAVGNTKILMRNEILAILEKAKSKAVNP
jgi:myosin heavy subunit